jgi:hypothetical protein
VLSLCSVSTEFCWVKPQLTDENVLYIQKGVAYGVFVVLSVFSSLT